VRQGRLQECSTRFADNSLVANSLVEACLTDQPTCAVTFQPVAGQIEVIPPPLYAPIGVEYDLSLLDRDGSATDPVRAVFCFDVGSNAPPVPAADTFQLTYPSRVQRRGVNYNNRCEKQQGSQGVLANDEDDEHVTNTCLTAELLELPRFASNLSTFRSTFGSNGAFVYEGFTTLPPEDSNGRSIDSFTYRVTDGVNAASDPVRVEIVFTNDNRPPQAVNDNFSFAEDSDVQVLPVLANDVDPDALPLTVVGISNGPGNGVATIRNGTVIEYRPGAGFVGQDNFTYTAEDSGGLTVTANVTISIANVNDPPVAQNDVVTTNENVPLGVRVLANDSDIENDPLTVVSAATPLHGSTVVASDGIITYTPDAGYFGPDSFEYTISDGADTATAAVVVNVVFVNVGPVVGADELFMSENTSEEFNLLDNDNDGDGDPLMIISVSTPASGVAALLPSGNVQYTPNAGFSGRDSFSYTVSDGTVESTGQVTIVVSSVNDLPIAANDSSSTVENTAVVISVLANDSDPDGDSLTVTSVGNVVSGSAFVSADNSTVTFTPADSFSGQGSFIYSISDGNGGTASATVTVLVSDNNQNPIAVDDTSATEVGDAVGIVVLGNDSDPDGDVLTVTSISNVVSGSASVNADNRTVTFTPAASFSGQASFIYSISDGNGGTASATVTVLVSDNNQNPIAVDDTSTTEVGDAVGIAVLDNDSDPDGDVLTVASISNVVSGSASINANNRTVTFTPAASFSGQASFIYSISDGNGGTASATVSVLVSNSNQNPIAVDDVRSTEEDDPVGIAVLDNDSDPDGDPLTLSVLTQPANGTASLTQAGNIIVYSPATGFSGTDSFTYQISDGNGGQAVATVTVGVSDLNVAPTAVADQAQLPQGQSIDIAVLANDVDPDGDSLSVSIALPPANGSATVLPDNRISYTPVASFFGADSIGYVIDDGAGGTSAATVSITITAVVVNNPPTASDDIAQATQGQAVNFNILANDSDPDGDSLTVAITAPPANGTAVVLPDNRISYTSAAAFAGVDSIGYTVDDGNGASDTATVSITVVASNNAPVAADDSATTGQGLAVSIDVLANDTDADGNALLVSTVNTAAIGATAILNNAVTYTPAVGFSGTDSFSYTVSDNNGGTDTASVSVTVTAANAAPTAADDAAVTQQATVVNIPVLANDSDPEGDTLAVSIVTGPANGFATIVVGTTINYEPAPLFSGVDSIVYSIDDGNGGTDTATVSISVTAVVVNQPPVAADDAAVTDEDFPVQIAVLSNDTDADNDPLTLGTFVQPLNGSVAADAAGVVTYTPVAGFSGVDTFSYEITDSSGAVSTATVTVTVNAIAALNTPPVAVDDAIAATTGSVTRIKVLDNDSDIDGDTLTLTLDAALPPTSGTVSVHNNGKWLNYSAGAVAGSDSFGYIIDDGNGGTDSAIVTVAINDL